MSSRRQLGAVIDDHANVAAAHLLEMEAARSERMDPVIHSQRSSPRYTTHAAKVLMPQA